MAESKEIITVSALYNSRRAEGMIMNIPQQTEEESVSLGGKSA